jgi:uncharacterized protein
VLPRSVVPDDHPSLALPGLDGPPDLRPGDPVALQLFKWDGAVHWRFPSVYLLTDSWGTWLGQSAGTPLRRPDRQIVQDTPCTVLLPHHDWWVATFHHAEYSGGRRLYVDAATPATWHQGPDGIEAHAVDLDLDVVQDRGADHGWIDDEDEFRAHAVAMRYPSHVVTAARGAADRVLRQVDGGREPFAARGHQLLSDWLSGTDPL